MSSLIIRSSFHLIIIILVLSSIISAQHSDSGKNSSLNLQFDRIDLSEFISNQYINCIGQDTFGFMWFGTRDGLCRYDGRNVKVYKSIPADTTSLYANEIQKIFTDTKGNLWIAAEGLHKYNPEKDNFIRIQPPLFDSLALKLKFINDICEDNQGSLWLGTFGEGLYKFNPASGLINYIRLGESVPPPFKDFMIFSLSFNGSDLIWAASNGHQFVSVNIHTNEQNHYYLPQIDPSGKQKGDIQKFFIDRKGNFWLAAIGEPLKQVFIDKNSNASFKSFDKIKPESFFAVFQDDINGNLWLGTQSEGVLVFNPSTNEIKNYRFNSRDVHSLPGDEIEDIFEDKSGNIWLATNKGVCKWSRWKKPFHHFQYDSENPNSIGSSAVTGIDEDDEGNLWISTLNTGFSKLNLSTGKVTRYDPTNSAIKSPWALEILSANDGTIWIATNFQHGLNRFDPRTGSCKEYLYKPQDKTSISSNLVTFLYQDKQNRIWIGAANRGLNLYNTEKDNFKRFVSDQSDKNSISSNEVYSIYENEENILWIGTAKGLNLFDLRNEIFKRFSPFELSDTSKSFEVLSICKNTKNDLWLGTSSGLYLFNIEEKSFKQMPDLKELQDSRIFGVLKDDSGNLWLQTISALVKFNPENKIYRIYDRNNGWIQFGVNEREWRSSYNKLKSGELVFGGSNGITIFNPDDIRDNPEVPPVYLTGFSLFNLPVGVNGNPFGTREDGDSILRKSILLTDEIILNHDENSFTFNFASLDFTNPSANQFKYKLEGFNKDWINSGKMNSASFTNIPPGEYTCSVKASSSDGVWNEKGASIKIIVLHPWWQTTFAYIVYASIFVAILFWIRRFEINRIRTRDQLRMKEIETKKLQEVDRIKSRFFANISHEFRTPLTLILGILDKYLKKTSQENSDFKVMKKNAERSLQLINQLLELSRLESGSAKIQVQKTDIIMFVRRIASSFMSLAEQKSIDFRFNNFPIASIPAKDEIFVFIDHKKTETVIYNLLSNAFKFTPEGEKIFIDVSSTIFAVEISITNYGTTIPEDEIPYVFDRFFQGSETAAKNFEGTGIGLALVKELVELHQGEVKVFSGENETTFRINLLNGNSHFSEDQILTEEKEIALETPALIPVVDEIQSLRKELRTEKRESGIVLVVEDHFDLRNFICEQLEDEYSVIEAEDGEKGLLLTAELLPDIVISDIMMPKMDGYQLCKEIKTNFKTNHIPVILLTAKAALENKLEGLDTGADDYLIKPFNTDELKTRVRNLIRVRQQMREKFRSEMILKPAEIIVPSNQRIFIEKLTGIIEKNIENENFSVEILSKEIGMSRSQLHRKVKALTNQSPNEFIRNFRLKRAADLIVQGAGNIAEISYKVGFSSQAYFTKLFQEMYGTTPTEFRKQSEKLDNQVTSQD